MVIDINVITIVSLIMNVIMFGYCIHRKIEADIEIYKLEQENASLEYELYKLETLHYEKGLLEELNK